MVGSEHLSGGRSCVSVGPDFLCVGSQKAGTRWLYDQLSNHPAVWMPIFKELHYFDRRFRPERMQAALDGRGGRRRRSPDDRDLPFLQHAVTYVDDTIDFAWYRRLFISKGECISGDITPAYSTLPDDIVAAISHGLPGVKILFLARDPIQRLWSQLAMEARRGSSIAGANYDDWSTLRNIIASPLFAGRSFPALTARTWCRNFGRERVFIGFFDDLQSRPEWLRAQVFDFLGITPDHSAPQLGVEHNVKAGAWKPPMSATVRGALVDHFREELYRCAEELGGPARDWPAQYGL